MSQSDQPSGGKSRHRVAAVGEVPEGGCKIVKVTRGSSEMELGIFQVGGRYFAYRNVCPHAGAPVCQGKISGTTLPSGVYEYDYSDEKKILRCPWHGWEFDLTTGRHLVDENMKLRAYGVEVEGSHGAESENLESYRVETEQNQIFVLI